jgi:hypothetical protein
VSDADVSERILEAAIPKLITWWTQVRQFASNRIAVEWASCNHIGRDGKYTSDQSFTTNFEAHPGTAPHLNNWLGPDAAMVVSLMTGKNRGYASRGRMYLPLNYFPLNTDAGPLWGSFSGTGPQTVATATATLLSDVNDLAVETGGLEIACCIFSPGTGKNQDPSKMGAYEPILNVQVGQQPDTMRRRLNKVPDLWGTEAKTAAVAS